MKSKWFAAFDAEQKKLRAQSQSKKILLPIIIVAMFACFGVLAITNGASAPAVLGGLGAPAVVIILVVGAALSKGKKFDPTADLRKDLERILVTDEDAALFDAEIAAAPLNTIPSTGNGKICFTEHFIYTDGFYMGHRTIAVAKYTEIKSNVWAKNNNGSVNPAKAVYFIDLLNENNEKVMGLTAAGAHMDQLETLLRQCCPGIILKQR